MPAQTFALRPGIVALSEARALTPTARPIEGPYGQGRLWAAFPPDSAAVALLCCDALAARVGAWVHEPVLAATEPGSHEALALGLRVALKRAMARSGVGGGFGRR